MQICACALVHARSPVFFDRFASLLQVRQQLKKGIIMPPVALIFIFVTFELQQLHDFESTHSLRVGSQRRAGTKSFLFLTLFKTIFKSDTVYFFKTNTEWGHGRGTNVGPVRWSLTWQELPRHGSGHGSAAPPIMTRLRQVEARGPVSLSPSLFDSLT
jgi:hypothetical protein